MPASDWAPQVDDVGSLLRARTRDDTGNELGTFVAETRPTDVQVETLIGAAQSELIGIFGSAEVRPRFIDVLRELATLGAALKIELSYYPEQISTDRSPYSVLYQQYRDLLSDVKAQHGEIILDDGDATTFDSTSPAWKFPRQPPLLGMRTPL